MIMKGQKINDRYQIIKSIGEGGMANVYLAYDTILDRDVAVKVLCLVKKKYPDAYVKYSGEYKKSSSNASYSSFYGIWVYASKSYDEASSFAGEVSSNGFQGFVFTTTDWSNLNSEKWYVVTAGQYGTEKEAINKLDAVQNYYPDAYVKYSGDHINN